MQGLGFVIEVISCHVDFRITSLLIHWFSLNLQKERTGVKTTYSQNVRSMLKYEYESVFFVCRKPWKRPYDITATTEYPIVAVYFLNNNKPSRVLKSIDWTTVAIPAIWSCSKACSRHVTLFPDVCCRQLLFECQRKFFVVIANRIWRRGPSAFVLLSYSTHLSTFHRVVEARTQHRLFDDAIATLPLVLESIDWCVKMLILHLK